MKRKAIWVVLIFLMVTSLVQASCTKSSTATQATPTTKTTTNQAVGTPIYGGTLTMYTRYSDHNPSGWDAPMTVDLSAAAIWANPFEEWLTRGDINTYGPRGNKQYGFNTWEIVPEQFLTGELATAWEIAPDGSNITFHIRQGVMWTGNKNIGMAARELVAADVASAEQRNITRPGFGPSFSWLKSIAATDKYTVVWTLNSYFANWPWRFGCCTAMGVIYPPEVVTAGPDNWKNQVGSGPFILTDYVEGSGATYTKNPNYWGKVVISGKSYQLPFIDTLVYPVIADASTRLAALRTGKVDWDPEVGQLNSSTLTQSSPDLLQQKYLSNTIYYLRINRLKSQSLSNLQVRQALMIGTDLTSIAKLVYGGGEIQDWPFGSNVPGYTPLDQLPASQKQLYTYNPTLAKQMIADAGYPNGFKMVIDSGTDSTSQDISSALVSNWAQIGVTATITSLDSTALNVLINNVTYPDSLLTTYGVGNPFTTLNVARSDVANPVYKPGELGFDAMYAQAMATVDPVKRTALIKDFGLALMNDVAVIPFANSNFLNCYWPWIKNYYGELETGYYNDMPMIKQMWLDQNLKKTLVH
jgi:peptide/nickel transport system substrate-binding protein